MRLPPSDLLRDTPPPEDLLLVVPGGEHSLSDVLFEPTTGNCWSRYLLCGVSVFGPPGDDLIAMHNQPNLNLIADVGEVGTRKINFNGPVATAPPVRIWLDMLGEQRGEDAAALFREAAIGY
ncbi:MAG: hypothetical protein ACLQFX_07360 [Acidimicrobiales bacterium]